VKQIQPELNRLGVLQRQILKWIRLEGGGCLPVNVLFTSLYNTQTYPDPVAMAERMAEAVEQLVRAGLVELRFDPPSKSKFPSLYDMGGLHKNLKEGKEGKWLWKSGNVPEVALTDFGNHYTAKMA
jgi:hypothetical protein